MSNDFVLINQAQIDNIVVIMDYILTHPIVTVGDIKRRFGLNEEQYQMIFELCMPHMRHRANERYWIMKYKSIFAALQELYVDAVEKKRKTISIEKINEVLKKNDIGTYSKESKDILEEYESDEEEDYEPL